MKTGSEKWQEIQWDWRGKCEGLWGVRERSLASREEPRYHGSLAFHLCLKNKTRLVPGNSLLTGYALPSAGKSGGQREVSPNQHVPNALLSLCPHGPATGSGSASPVATPPAPCPPHRIASSRSRSSNPSSGRSPPAPRRACCGCTAPGPSPL